MDLSFFLEQKQLFTIMHVFSVVVGMGAAFVTDILFTLFASNRTLSRFEISVIRFLSRVVMIALGFIIVTGFCIFLSDTDKYLNSAKFLTKMTVIAVLSINGALLHFYVFKHLSDKNYLTNKKSIPARKISFALGSISFVSWTTALSLGVLDKITIPYLYAVSIYLSAVICGILFSQIILQQFSKRN